MWHLVSDSQPELLVPVLFIYDGVLYSGYYYEDAEDAVNDTVSYIINTPDSDNTVDGDHSTLSHKPTHWGYLEDCMVRLPETIEENG